MDRIIKKDKDSQKGPSPAQWIMIVGAGLILFAYLLYRAAGIQHIDELGKDYYTSSHNGMLVVLHPIRGENPLGSAHIVVPEGIIDYDFDEKYVIAAVRPRDSVAGIQNLPLDSVIARWRESKFREYFILDKYTDSVYGPYDKKNFERQRKLLHLSSKLSFNNDSISQ